MPAPETRVRGGLEDELGHLRRFLWNLNDFTDPMLRSGQINNLRARVEEKLRDLPEESGEARAAILRAAEEEIEEAMPGALGAYQKFFAGVKDHSQTQEISAAPDQLSDEELDSIVEGRQQAAREREAAIKRLGEATLKALMPQLDDPLGGWKASQANEMETLAANPDTTPEQLDAALREAAARLGGSAEQAVLEAWAGHQAERAAGQSEK